MSRDPKPWFRKDRDAWFVTINGRRFNLGPDREGAHTRFHELMLNHGVDDPYRDVTVFQLFDEFLEWTKAQRAPRTYEWYRDFLRQFSKFLKVDRPASRIRPVELIRWMAKNPHWGGMQQRNCIRAVQRAFRWGQRMGILDKNPVQFVDKPAPVRREQIITPDEYQTILDNIRTPAFRELIVAAWETGARPQELVRLEVRHVELAKSRWVFSPKEAKVKTRHRIIYLNAEAQRITRDRLDKIDGGAVFRNKYGRPWHPWAISCQFTRLQERIGRRLCLYVFRHSFATRMLTAGVDPMTVATLLGHADTSMLGKIYQHLAQCPDHLLTQLNRVSDPFLSV